MITKNQLKNQVPAWQKSLSSAIRDPKVLLQRLGLPLQYPFSPQAMQDFKLLVPESYVQRMEYGKWDDPLLRQVLPIEAELERVEGFVLDPVHDTEFALAEGVLKKYQGRALLVTTGACGIHCRYCFRRHFDYAEANPAQNQWQDTVKLARERTDLKEVILSGGDPLSLSDKRLLQLVSELETIPHIQRIRLHTRMPIVLPERVTPELLAWMSQSQKKIIIVVHANHAQELNAHDVQTAFNDMANTGATLLNQAVLLRGVNDSVAALVSLSEALFANHTLPYYLHVLDRVQGAAHFEVSDKEALELMEQVRASLSGYLVPTLVREVAGDLSKRPL